MEHTRRGLDWYRSLGCKTGRSLFYLFRGILAQSRHTAVLTSIHGPRIISSGVHTSQRAWSLGVAAAAAFWDRHLMRATRPPYGHHDERMNERAFCQLFRRLFFFSNPFLVARPRDSSMQHVYTVRSFCALVSDDQRCTRSKAIDAYVVGIFISDETETL